MINFKGFDDWIEIFRGGKQIDSSGVTHDGDELIDKAVASFDPRFHEPPVVVGHPKEDSPAFGWVEALRTGFKDGVKVLYAKIKDVVPEFREAVQKGLYKKRSAAFYPDGTLRHVGFLGAAPPAVKGLADLAFTDEESIVFEFAAPDAAKKDQEARSKKYGISIKPGGHVTKPSEWADVPDDEWLDPVNYRYPCPDAAQTRAAAAYWGKPKNQEQYTPEERAIINARLNKFKKKFNIGEYRKEGVNMSNFKEKVKRMLNFLGMDIDKIPDDAFPEEFPEGSAGRDGSAGGTFSEADIKKAQEQAREEERRRLEAEFAEKERERAKAAREKEISDWVETRVKAGKILPSWVNSGLTAFMQKLDADTEIEFAEGAPKKSPLKYFQDMLDDLGKSPIFKEIATKEKAGDSAEFAEAKKEQELGESIAAKVNKPSANRRKGG